MRALGNKHLLTAYTTYQCKPRNSVQRKRRNMRAALVACLQSYIAAVAPVVAPAPVVAKPAGK